MKTLDRKLGRDLYRAKGLLAAIIVIVAVGVLCLVALRSSYNNLVRSKADYYARCRMADFTVSLKKAPRPEALRLIEIPGVSAVHTRVTFEVTVDLETVVEPLSGRAISLPDSPRPIINDIVLRQGGYFTPMSRDEVIVSDAFARAHELKPGDSLRLILNNRKHELRIVGTAISSEFVYLIQPGELAPAPERYGIFYLKESFAEEAYDFDGACNEVLGLIDPAHRPAPKPIAAEAERLLDDYGVFTVTPLSDQPSNKMLSDEITGLEAFAVFLPGLFLSVAALVLNLLMMRLAEQQRTIVGTLKAIGYDNRAIILHFVKFAMVIGLIGGLVGVGLGYALAGYMTELYATFYEFPRLVNQVYPSIWALSVLVSVGFALLGTLRSVRSISRLDPAEAMRQKPEATGKTIILERVAWLWKRLGFKMQMTLRYIWRHRTRTAVGAFAGSMGVALLLLSLASFDSMHHLIDFQFSKVLGSDYDLTLSDEATEEAVREALRLPGVDEAEPIFVVPCTLRNGQHERKFSIMGLKQGARLTTPRTGDGARAALPEAGLLLSAKLAEVLHTQPGATIELTPIRGDRIARRADVSATIDTFIGMLAYADYDYLNRLMGEEAAVSMIQLKVDPRQTVEFQKAVKELPAVQTLTSNIGRRANLEKLITETSGFSITVMIVFAGAIFAASIFTASLISLGERQREIATFHAMGFTMSEISGIFLRESLIVNSAGVAAGLPIGYGLLMFMVKMYDTELYRLPLVVDLSTYFGAVALAAVFVVLSHLVVHRLILKMNWREALNVKE